MRKLCPNFDREDGRETVLEVPIPEGTFAFASDTRNNGRSWHNMKSWMTGTLSGCRNAELQLLLGVLGAPVVPLPVRSDHSINRNIKDHPIEGSVAKYIVKQYIAATVGEKALNSIDSMYAMGKVRMHMVALEFCNGDDFNGNSNNEGVTKAKMPWDRRGGRVRVVAAEA